MHSGQSSVACQLVVFSACQTAFVICEFYAVRISCSLSHSPTPLSLSLYISFSLAVCVCVRLFVCFSICQAFITVSPAPELPAIAFASSCSTSSNGNHVRHGNNPAHVSMS